jgi:hypothetical protein
VERVLVEWPAHDPERQPIATFERHTTRGGGTLDARHRLKALDAIAQQELDGFSLDVFRAGKRHAHREHIARVVPWVHVAQVDERPDQQRRTDEQQQRQRHLDDDEDRASLVVAERGA